jgi:chaperone required for assembly of F1-ATPase
MASQPSRQRFYKSARFAEHDDGGFAVQLDGRLVKTPGGKTLAVPTRQLVKAIAAEWDRQGETIDPASLPLTRLANSAIDGAAGREGEVAGDILKYAAADLVCYRAAYPAGLAEAQAKLWDPVLTWIKERYNAPFQTGLGIAHVTQPPSSLAALRTELGSFGAFKLTALHVMTSLTGSALIALTYAGGGLDVAGAWAAAHADENWQVSQWGEDFEAAQRQKTRFTEFESAARFFTLS